MIGQHSSYAPSQGKFKQVEESGYLGFISSPSGSSFESGSAGQKQSYAPGAGSYRVVQDSGYLGSVSLRSPAVESEGSSFIGNNYQLSALPELSDSSYVYTDGNASPLASKSTAGTSAYAHWEPEPADEALYSQDDLEPLAQDTYYPDETSQEAYYADETSQEEYFDELFGFCPYEVHSDLKTASLAAYSLDTEISNESKGFDSDKLIVLQRLGDHNLNIASFEVVLDADSAGDFGWTMYDTDYFVGNTVVDKGYIAGSLFVGPDQPAEVTVYSTEEVERIKTTKFVRRSDKTVICCANYGSEWYVNGELVATTPGFMKGICKAGIPAPYVGIQKGSFRFTKLDLVD